MTARVDPLAVAERAAALREKIAHRAGRRVTLVAVTKGFGPEATQAAVAAGIMDLGENYAQELEAKASKAEAEGSAPRWHFIGHLQRNKVKRLTSWVHLWQSVDRRAVVEELAKRAAGASVLIQVNATGEPQKAGCGPGDTPALVRTAAEAGLDVQGLMAIGPTRRPGAERAWQNETRSCFETVRDLADELALPEVSMGMSADLEIALDCGSTMVRIGTALFGSRSPGSVGSGG